MHHLLQLMVEVGFRLKSTRTKISFHICKFFWLQTSTEIIESSSGSQVIKPNSIVIYLFLLSCRWFCHVDDDNYVNPEALLSLLSGFPQDSDIYVGKPSLDKPITGHELLEGNKTVSQPLFSLTLIQRLTTLQLRAAAQCWEYLGKLA